MNNQRSWKERWKEKDLDGDTVVDVAMWSDGTAALYKYRQASGYERNTINVTRLIPIKPAPVTVAWEPDEVPVGAVVMMVKNPLFCGTIANRSGNMIGISGHRYVTCEELKDEFVLHQPGIPTEQCQPCGKVVQS